MAGPPVGSGAKAGKVFLQDQEKVHTEVVAAGIHSVAVEGSADQEREGLLRSPVALVAPPASALKEALEVPAPLVERT